MASFSLKRIKPWRRLSQFFVLIAFILIPFFNSLEINQISGGLLAFNAFGIPLGDPLAVLQVALNTQSATRAMLVGGGLVLLLALVVGPVFCSWICPFGFLSELVHRKHKGSTKGIPPSNASPFLVKVAIVLVGLLAVLMLGEPYLNNLSLPGWYTRIMQHVFLYRRILPLPLVLLLAVLAVERLTGRRLWCRFICPQSVLISLSGLILPRRMHIRYRQGFCVCPASRRACLASCSLNLNPREPSLTYKAQCTNCGDCVDACAKRGKALRYGLGKAE